MNIEPEIKISFKYIGYSEGNNTVELDIERGESNAYLYVPDDHKWDDTYKWAKGKKQLIIDMILKKLYRSDPNYKIIVKEF